MKILKKFWTVCKKNMTVTNTECRTKERNMWLDKNTCDLIYIMNLLLAECIHRETNIKGKYRFSLRLI